MNSQKESITVERLTGLFEQNRTLLLSGERPAIAHFREQAMESFRTHGFPHSRMEAWRNTDLKESITKEYDYFLAPQEIEDIQKVFRCNIPHLDTAVIAQLNGWYVAKDVPLMELGNGIIMGSLAEALVKFPELVEKHLYRYADVKENSLTALNTAFARDGIFIYVPDSVTSNKAIQMVNVIQHPENLFLQSRNLIILGKNSKLTLVHCDDSYDQHDSFSNIVTEVFVDEGATLDHYKLQNLNNNSTLVNSMYFHLEKEADLESHFISLNGGLLRNNIRVLFNGPGGNANIHGLYLMDRKQHIDNQVFIDHAHPNCTSRELFKGILDDNASGVFNGHVLVRKNSPGTNAYQSNRNILLTESAKINSKPFLEIYSDDVKCSHGSTVGQLDNEAMFYLKQRCISEESARMLLMYAFADEVISKVTIGPLRHRIEDMVKKRLRGELQICEQCVLHCSTPDHPLDFQIDLTKI